MDGLVKMMQTQEKKFKLADIKVIIGLGNPGQKYHWTRHNIGFLILDALAAHCGIDFKKTDLMEWGEGIVPETSQKVILIKPQTFMNDSGQVISQLLKKGIKANQILVVHDELEKKFGVLQTRLGGSARGHNGLKSIADYLGLEFWRFRFGVDRPESHDKTDVGSYVLASFSPNELKELDSKIEQSLKFLLKGS